MCITVIAPAENGFDRLRRPPNTQFIAIYHRQYWAPGTFGTDKRRKIRRNALRNDVKLRPVTEWLIVSLFD